MSAVDLGSTTPSEPTYETVSPALAAALIAAGCQVGYSHCALHPNGRDPVFVFRDPLRLGEALQRSYAACTLPLVHAKLLADVRNKLMDEANRVKRGGRREAR